MKKPVKVPEVVEVPPPERICGTCRHHLGEECHKMSPVPVGCHNSHGRLIYMGVWPVVGWRDNCSQWGSTA